MKIVITEVSDGKTSTTKQQPAKKTKVAIDASLIAEIIRKKADENRTKIANGQR